MELTRRDVIIALSAVGVGSVASVAEFLDSERHEGHSSSDIRLSDHEVETVVALAEVVYPSDVDSVATFVRDYFAVRVNEDDSYARGVGEAITELDDYVSEWHDETYASLSASARADILDQMTVDTANPNPTGVASERIRYYLVNELLYAFYATPTGAALVGLENPPGHPGGTQSYQQRSAR